MNRTLLVILMWALILRLGGIEQPLWYDEAYTAMLVKLPFGEMVTATINDVHPPTWYLITWPFVRIFGMTEFTLRLPALLFGMLAVYLAWRIAEHFVGDREALIVAGMMTAAPFAVYYSNEGRVYAFLMAAVLVAILGIVERNHALAVAGIAATLYSHNMAVIYLPLFGLLAWRRVGFRRAALLLSAGMLPWLVWLPFVVRQAAHIDAANGGYWVADIANNRIALQLDNVNALLFTHFAQDWIIPVNVLITFCLVAFPLAEAIRLRERRVLTLAVMAFLPMVVSVIISLAWQPMSIARTLAGCLPPWLALIAWWVMRPRRWDDGRLILIAMCAIILVAPLFSYYTTFDRSFGMRDALAWLSEIASPDDVVCHADSSSVVLTKYYYHRGPAVILIPGNLRNQMSAETMNTAGIEIVAPETCDWLVYVRSPLLDEDVEPAVDSVLNVLNATVVRRIYEGKGGTTVELWRLSEWITARVRSG